MQVGTPFTLGVAAVWVFQIVGERIWSASLPECTQRRDTVPPPKAISETCHADVTLKLADASEVVKHRCN